MESNPVDRAFPHRGSRTALASALCALASLCAILVAARPAHAQVSRGPLVVLGLRAPDGDDDAATNATNAFRRAARAAGFQVPDNSPALEASIATFGCDDSVPAECLAQIANEQHAERMLYGAVRRAGRGRAAPLRIEVSLYTSATRAITPGAPVEIPRATAMDSDAMVTTARRSVDALLPPETPSQVVTGPSQPPVTVTPGRPAPIRRYIGFGVGAVGVGLLVVGIVQGVGWLSLQSEANQPGHPWYNYQPVGSNGMFIESGDELCTAARNGAQNRHPEGATTSLTEVLSICDRARTLSTLTWTLGAAGVALIATGIVLIVTDTSGSAPPANETNAQLRSRLRRPQFDFNPIMSPTTQGASFRLTF